MRKIFVAIIFISALVTGCGFMANQSTSPTVIPISDLLINQNSSYAPTPTPFQPIPPTPTAGLPSIPINTEVPNQEPPTLEPTSIPIPVLSKPAGQVNILLLGSDWRANQGFRTDVILLLSLNKNTGTATLLSFPRDLYVSIPGVGMERINVAQEYGGIALTSETFKDNFGIDIDYYMMTNFNGFTSIVDTLGGINVYATWALNDVCALPQAVDGYCYIPAGSNYMNGQTALWYVRSRYSSSDFDRTRRAQEVMVAIFQKAMNLNALSRGPELYDLFRNSVETNIPVSAVVDLLPLGSKILSDPSMIRRFAIGGDQVSNYIVPGTGAMVLIPDDTLVSQVIQQALGQ